MYMYMMLCLHNQLYVSDIAKQRGKFEEHHKIGFVNVHQERNVSSVCHEKLLRALLAKSGVNIVCVLVDISSEDATVMPCYYAYDQIIDINEEEFDAISTRKENESCTEEYRLQWEKHFFQAMIIRDYDKLLQEQSLDTIGKMFIDFRKQNSTIMQKRQNLRAEMTGKGDYHNIFQSNQAQQLMAVQIICGLLGITNSWELGVEIPRAQLEAAAEQVLKLKPEFVKVFNLTQGMREDGTKKPKSVVERACQIINREFNVWGHTKVVPMGKRERSRFKQSWTDSHSVFGSG